MQRRIRRYADAVGDTKEYTTASLCHEQYILVYCCLFLLPIKLVFAKFVFSDCCCFAADAQVSCMSICQLHIPVHAKVSEALKKLAVINSYITDNINKILHDDACWPSRQCWPFKNSKLKI